MIKEIIVSSTPFYCWGKKIFEKILLGWWVIPLCLGCDVKNLGRGGEKENDGNQHFIILLILTWGLRYSQKRGGTEKWWAEIEDWCTSEHLYWCFKKISYKAIFFDFFGDGKKKLLKVIFSFIPRLLNSSDLSNYGVNLRKRYALLLLSNPCV